jgi:hypothetical protein
MSVADASAAKKFLFIAVSKMRRCVVPYVEANGTRATPGWDIFGTG